MGHRDATAYLQFELGLSAIEAGLVYVPGTLLNFFVAGSMASVGQKVSPRVLVAGGLALIGTGLALLTLLEADSSWWLFLPGLLVAMVGTGMLRRTASSRAYRRSPAVAAYLQETGVDWSDWEES